MREKESRHGSPARSSAIDSSRTRAERKAFSRMTFAHSRRLDAAPAVLADHPLRSRDVIVEFLLRQSASVSRLLAISPLCFVSPSSLPFPLFASLAYPTRLDASRWVTRMIVCSETID